MKPQKSILTVLSVLIVGMFVATTMLSTDEEEANSIIERYNMSTQNYRRNTVETIIAQTEDKDESVNIPGVNAPTTANDPNNPNQSNIPIPSDDWVKLVDAVHKAWGAAGFTYNGNTHKFNDNGTELDVRTDCSGYVGFCLYKMGFTNNTIPISSRDAVSFVTGIGGSVIDQANVAEGDILVYSGHVEIFHAVGIDGKTLVWNWGGHRSAEDVYAGKDPSTVTSFTTTGRPLSSATIIRIPNKN